MQITRRTRKRGQDVEDRVETKVFTSLNVLKAAQWLLVPTCPVYIPRSYCSYSPHLALLCP